MFLDLMTDIDKYSELSGEELKCKLKDFAKLINVDFNKVKEYISLYPCKVYKNIYEGGMMNELVFETKRLLSVANSRQGWYRMATIREINFLQSPAILNMKTKDRPGLVDPLAYYLSYA